MSSFDECCSFLETAENFLQLYTRYNPLHTGRQCYRHVKESPHVYHISKELSPTIAVNYGKYAKKRIMY